MRTTCLSPVSPSPVGRIWNPARCPSVGVYARSIWPPLRDVGNHIGRRGNSVWGLGRISNPAYRDLQPECPMRVDFAVAPCFEADPMYLTVRPAFGRPRPSRRRVRCCCWRESFRRKTDNPAVRERLFATQILADCIEIKAELAAVLHPVAPDFVDYGVAHVPISSSSSGEQISGHR